MSTARNRILSLALAVCLLLAMTLVVPGPVTVSANVGIADGRPPNADIEAYKTVIGFAGQEWYVIGYNDTGVKPDDDDYVILLLKTGQTGSRPYTDSEFGGTHVYNGSTLHDAMQGIYDDSNDGLYQEARERALVVERTLDGVNNSTGGSGNDTLPSEEFVWPLSEAEYYTVWSDTEELSGSALLAYSDDWWLRSPDLNNDYGAWVGAASGAYLSTGIASVNSSRAVRPAFQLNLESVLFTSDASGASAKISVNDTDGLVNVQTLGNGIKLTVEDNGLAVDIDNVVVTGNTVDFDYSVTNGSPNRLSAIVRDEDGAVTHYGNLANNPGISGTATVTLPTGFDPDKDALEVFVEEVKTGNHTDFASKPQKVGFPEPAKLDVAAPIFSAVTVDYSQLPAQAITIKNTGDTDATITGVSLTSGDTTAFAIDDTAANYTVNGKSENTTWKIQPEADFLVGSYTAIITVTYDGGENTTGDTATAEVKFVVQADPPAPGTPALTANRTNMNFGEVETGDTKTDTVEVTGTDLTLSIGYSVSGVDAAAFSVSAASGWSDTDGGDLDVTFSPDDERDYTATLTITNADTGDVTVSLSGKGVADGGGDNGNGNGNGNGNNGGNSSSGSRSRSSSGGSSTPDSRVAKTQLPASAFAWDGDRTLTITHDNITALGLLSVQWDGQTLTRGTDFTAHQGSVIVRFDEDFMAARSTGSHTVRVEFLNHTGETTVTVGATGAAGDGPATSTGGTDNPDTGGDGGYADNATHNPNTGGYPDGSYSGTTDNPNTGDGRGIWLALLLGSMVAAALVKLRPRLEVK